MPSKRINLANNKGIYFVTFTVKDWLSILNHHNRWNILADSLNYCIKNKNLKVYGYVFMLNHIHLIIESYDTAGFIRDFKRYTSKQIKLNLLKHEPNLIPLFLDKKGLFTFWKKTNMPIQIETEKFLLQKMNYIHLDPVKR